MNPDDKLHIKQLSAPEMLNESYEYEKPVPFSRGLRIDWDGPATLVVLSGTASVDHEGKSIHLGDIKAQARRTLNNITALLKEAQTTWHDVIKTTIYLKDIQRDYDALNQVVILHPQSGWHQEAPQRGAPNRESPV